MWVRFSNDLKNIICVVDECLYFKATNHIIVIFNENSGKIKLRKEVLIMLDNLSEDLKKILLAGVGAVAISVEKSKDVVDELVKKGELTVEQGKVLNEELKHDIKEKLACKKTDVESISKKIEGFTKEELAALKEKIDTLQNTDGEENAE